MYSGGRVKRPVGASYKSRLYASLLHMIALLRASRFPIDFHSEVTFSSLILMLKLFGRDVISSSQPTSSRNPRNSGNGGKKKKSRRNRRNY